jgi:hypothetical protein
MLQTDSRRVGDENLVKVPTYISNRSNWWRVVVGNSPAPAPRAQPTSMGDLLLESGRGMAFQKRLIGGSAF